MVEKPWVPRFRPSKAESKANRSSRKGGSGDVHRTRNGARHRPDRSADLPAGVTHSEGGLEAALRPSLGLCFAPHPLERRAAADVNVVPAHLGIRLVERRLGLLERLALIHYLARLRDPSPQLVGARVGLGHGRRDGRGHRSGRGLPEEANDERHRDPGSCEQPPDPASHRGDATLPAASRSAPRRHSSRAAQAGGAA